MILCSFLLRFRWKTLESHNSKQMTFYEQITFSIKIDVFNFCLNLKIDFLIKQRTKTWKNLGGGNFTEDS